MRFFVRFSLSALKYRRQRLLLAFGALAVGAALATVMFGIYSSVAKRLRDEFRGYGANLVAVGVDGGTVPLMLADAAEKLGASASPLLITGASVNGSVAAIVGVKSIRTYSYWHVAGESAVAPGKCLAGELLGLRQGDAVTAGNRSCTVAGIVSTGGAEDRELIVDFDTAAAIAGIQNAASAIEIQAPQERMEAIRAELAQQFPGTEVRTVRAVAETESNVIIRMRTALLLLTLLILIITAICVSSNFSEMVIERAKEIGIMKALGGAEGRIAQFFISESAVLAASASVVGYACGIFATAAIARQVFGGGFQLQIDPLVLSGVVIVTMVVAMAATSVATARIRSIDAAVILRGE